MVGGGLHGNGGPAQDPCKELATGLSKGVLETQPKQNRKDSSHDSWVLPWPSHGLRGLETNQTPHTACQEEEAFG